MKTELMTIAKAMCYKNRLIEKIKKLDEKIKKQNSRPADSTVSVNADELYKQRMILVGILVDLKTAISKANMTVIKALSPATAQYWIYRLAELKSAIALLNLTSTSEGKVRTTERDYYSRNVSNEPIEYVADITEKEKEEMIEDMQTDIDEIQEALADFNSKTQISVGLID